MVGNSVENHRPKSPLLCDCGVGSGDVQVVSELSELSCQISSPVHEGLRLRTNAVFDVIDALVQHLPDHPAEAMSDGPYGGLIAEPGQQSTEDGLEMGTPSKIISTMRLLGW